MKSGFEHTGAVAEVTSLAAVRVTRAAAGGLAADWPGWRCWYSPRAGLWFGKRIVERWVPEMTGRAYVVIAEDPAMLHAVITTQAILDLAIESSSWRIECMAGGYWWAMWHSAANDLLRPIFCEVSAVKLAASLRRYMASMDEPDDLRLV
jgi:hypothetical protein